MSKRVGRACRQPNDEQEGERTMPRRTTEEISRQPHTGRYDERRGEIADIASRLFAERGYHATSMQDLTDAIGLQRGALYHYINAKKDLLYLIHDRLIQPLNERLRDIDSREEPPEVALREIAHALMQTIHDQRDQVTVFLHEWKAIRGDEGWASVRDSRREFETMVERALERGVEEGVFSLDNVRIATLGFLGMMNYAYTWIEPDGEWDADYIADQFADMYLNGIRATKPARKSTQK